jgi:hypothetical protein
LNETPLSDPPPPSRSSANLALRTNTPSNQADDLRLQQLWIALEKRPWRSLALLAGSRGVATLDVADLLAKIAWWYSGEPTSVFDLRDLSVRLVDHQLRELEQQLAAGDRVFVALRSTLENPSAVRVAQACDAVALLVALGETDVKSAEGTINAVGRERFLGSILLPTRGSVRRQPAAKPARGT